MADLSNVVRMLIHQLDATRSYLLPSYCDEDEKARAVIAFAESALAAEPVEGLSPKEIEAQEAFTQMCDEVLGGVEGFDNDQINSILRIIDNYTPEWV